MSELHRHTDTPRLDIHNAQVNTAAAMRHLCGMTHLASGRLCLLPERHPARATSAFLPTPAGPSRTSRRTTD